ncbi:unnamed protein product [Effrenium voratum]|nr:unnamed protein product [Effrenium voratum]
MGAMRAGPLREAQLLEKRLRGGLLHELRDGGFSALHHLGAHDLRQNRGEHTDEEYRIWLGFDIFFAAAFTIELLARLMANIAIKPGCGTFWDFFTDPVPWLPKGSTFDGDWGGSGY